MKKFEVTVTREVDIADLYQDLEDAFPDFCSIEEAGIDDDNLDKEMLLSLMKAVVEYMESDDEEE